MTTRSGTALAVMLTAALVPRAASAQSLPGEVVDHVFVTEFAGGFDADLGPGDRFGTDVTSLGDLSGDGTVELAVGAPFDDDGFGLDSGAVWILSLDGAGHVVSHVKLSKTTGGLGTTLPVGGRFGDALASVGDLDGDGVTDLAVGAPFDDGEGNAIGALWLLTLNPDGTVRTQRKIDATDGWPGAPLSDGDLFGDAVAVLEDLDGNGVPELAVGAPWTDDGATTDVGAVYVLFLSPAGTVSDHVRIGQGSGGFTPVLEQDDQLGYELAAAGDIDGDGIGDLAVASLAGGFAGDEVVYILFMQPDGTVREHVRLAEGEAGLAVGLQPGDAFGAGLDGPGDLDHDGVPDLVAGAPRYDGSDFDSGAALVLFLSSDGTVKAHTTIHEGVAGFAGSTPMFERFGASLCALPDLDGDGTPELAVGQPYHPFIGPLHGGLHVLRLTDGQWVDLGLGLAGPSGVPVLAGDGVPLPGEPFVVSLSGAAPGGTAWVVLGLSSLFAPFEGGTLVPSIDKLLLRALDAAGGFTSAGAWPPGLPVGTSVWLQAWIPGATGYAASNGLVVTTP